MQDSRRFPRALLPALGIVAATTTGVCQVSLRPEFIRIILCGALKVPEPIGAGQCRLHRWPTSPCRPRAVVRSCPLQGLRYSCSSVVLAKSTMRACRLGHYRVGTQEPASLPVCRGHSAGGRLGTTRSSLLRCAATIDSQALPL